MALSENSHAFLLYLQQLNQGNDTEPSPAFSPIEPSSIRASVVDRCVELLHPLDGQDCLSDNGQTTDLSALIHKPMHNSHSVSLYMTPIIESGTSTVAMVAALDGQGVYLVNMAEDIRVDVPQSGRLTRAFLLQPESEPITIDFQRSSITLSLGKDPPNLDPAEPVPFTPNPAQIQWVQAEISLDTKLPRRQKITLRSESSQCFLNGTGYCIKKMKHVRATDGSYKLAVELNHQSVLKDHFQSVVDYAAELEAVAQSLGEAPQSFIRDRIGNEYSPWLRLVSINPENGKLVFDIVLDEKQTMRVILGLNDRFEGLLQALTSQVEKFFRAPNAKISIDFLTMVSNALRQSRNKSIFISYFMKPQQGD